VGKGGVVRDPKLHRSVIERVLASAADTGLAAAGVIRSPITGGRQWGLAYCAAGRRIPVVRMRRWLNAR
jgi:23S rRNA (cytidine1920-2'-O)/16S rRNA (cytidine1409-2'-O)-methyltransferase